MVQGLSLGDFYGAYAMGGYLPRPEALMDVEAKSAMPSRVEFILTHNIRSGRAQSAVQVCTASHIY